jgi:hypothetical protein
MSKEIDLAGLWEGELSGDDQGKAWLNLYCDEQESNEEIRSYKGSALFRSKPNNVALYYDVEIIVENATNQISTSNLYNIHFSAYKSIQDFSETRITQKPYKGKMCDLSFREDKLSGKWQAIGGDEAGEWEINGNLSFSRCSREDIFKTIQPKKISSHDLIKELNTIYPNGFYQSVIFRGQSSTKWKLKTSFHRTKKAKELDALKTFMLDYLPELANSINSESKNSLQLQRGWFKEIHSITKTEYLICSILSIAQHHGHPTPLLDWTYSPHVATFFANQTSQSNISTARIFALNKKCLDKLEKRGNFVFDENFANLITIPAIHSSDNPRSVPQQSLFTFSTIGEIESYLELLDYLTLSGEIPNQHEFAQPQRLLHRFDIDFSESFLTELDTMGINFASLFPGLEGICKSLKQRHFS